VGVEGSRAKIVLSTPAELDPETRVERVEAAGVGIAEVVDCAQEVVIRVEKSRAGAERN
jgi:hypothetical protein